MKCDYQQCTHPNREITKNQTPYAIATGIIVHYTRCKPAVENEIHINGTRTAFEKTVLKRVPVFI